MNTKWIFIFSFLVGCAATKVIEKIEIADAQAGSKTKCDYTYIKDSGAPELGINGEIDYDDDWSEVLNKDFKLKGVHSVGSTGYYLFERCRKIKGKKKS